MPRSARAAASPAGRRARGCRPRPTRAGRFAARSARRWRAAPRMRSTRNSRSSSARWQYAADVPGAERVEDDARVDAPGRQLVAAGRPVVDLERARGRRPRRGPRRGASGAPTSTTSVREVERALRASPSAVASGPSGSEPGTASSARPAASSARPSAGVSRSGRSKYSASRIVTPPSSLDRRRGSRRASTAAGRTSAAARGRVELRRS